LHGHGWFWVYRDARVQRPRMALRHLSLAPAAGAAGLCSAGWGELRLRTIPRFRIYHRRRVLPAGDAALHAEPDQLDGAQLPPRVACGVHGRGGEVHGGRCADCELDAAVSAETQVTSG